MMSEFAEGTAEEKKSFWSGLPDVPGYLEEKVPTMDRSLDTYFDKNMEAIIEEWGLLVENDLIDLERRLNRASEQVTRLGHTRERMKERIEKLDVLISSLEKR